MRQKRILTLENRFSFPFDTGRNGDATMMATASSSASVCSTTSTRTTGSTTSTNSASTTIQRDYQENQQPGSVILVKTTATRIDHHHRPICIMTIDIEEPIKAKPQRKDPIGAFHKKIVHEDTERGDIKSSGSNGNSHTFVVHQQPQSSSLSPQQLPTLSLQSQNPVVSTITNAIKQHSIERAPVSRGSSGLPLTMSISAASAAAGSGAHHHEPRLVPR
jgi:hypothetical protein